MTKIPAHNYNVSELDEAKMISVVYQYQLKDGEWYADTWNMIFCSTIDEAFRKVSAFCEANLDNNNWDAYEITNINVIRR